MARQSPFPGMDPYLELSWRDVHGQLVTYASAALNGVLPEELVARIEERIVIDGVDYERPRAIFPDVRVYRDASPSSAGETQAGAAAAEPIVLEFDVDRHTEKYVTVTDPSGELISVIEFLSPASKLPGDGREQYLKKRGELVAAKVNVVEVDLVRQGRWRELLRPVAAPAELRSVYRVVTRRFHPMERIELYPISIRQPLPIIPIPLRDRDRDVPLALQGPIEQAYRNGRYDHTDYGQSCDPPLDEEDAAWADGLLRQADLTKA